MKTLLETRITKRESTEDIGKVDVVVLTKNSEEQLERCLSAIYQNVPLNRLILIDGYSTDRTLDIVSEFEKKYHNVVLIQDNGWRGKARQIGINNVNTKWFMFVDSDAELCKRWFEKAKSFISPDVGALWGIEIWPGIQNPEILNLFLKITRKIFELRGGTHDLLLRYDAIVGIAIPDNLHVFEDAFIKEWIAKRGYKVIPTYDPYCIHYRPQAVWTIKGSLDLIIETLRFASIRKMPSYIVAYGFYAAYVTHRIISGRKLSLSHLSN